MKKRFSEEQIIGILKEAEAGKKTKDLCRHHGITEQTFYRWKAKFGGMELSDAKRLKALEDENRRLKRLVAEQALDNLVLKDLLTKKVLRPKEKRQCVEHTVSVFGLSKRRACRLSGLAGSTFHYELGDSGKDSALRSRMHELAAKHRRFGLPRLHAMLRAEGLVTNHKRSERIYHEERLSLRTKRRHRKMPELRIVRPQPAKANDVWAMDFVSDALYDCRRFRALTVVDCFTKESPLIYADTSISGLTVVRLLDGLFATGEQPKSIRVDQGAEFTSKALMSWAQQRGIALDFSRAGKPTDNAFIESFNGKFRNECLNQNWFFSLAEARQVIEEWRKEYNEVRPHSSLGYLPPAAFAKREKIRLNGATN
ncbi:MAG: IS3 family transposase [Nitrospinae bacterium]|nr:IS3 family transposase [Nitrospinota bacterium]